MGTVVRFRGRRESAAAKTEAILERIGQHYRLRHKAGEELPRVLAQLLEAGQRDLVLRAVSLWGSGVMESHHVLSMVEETITAQGIQIGGLQPSPDC